MQYFIGIDVSKAKLDVALLAHDKFKSKVFANNTAGFEALLQWLQTHVPEAHTSLHLCMEATGSYHEALVCFLSDQALVVSVVNPLLVKRFAEANRLRNKTDGGDAKCLALFCKTTQPERWEAPLQSGTDVASLGGSSGHAAGHAPSRVQPPGSCPQLGCRLGAAGH
ncbi:MAG: transposase [Polaromonas sp.]|nr:transposase [Polaromonas sp.]